MRRFIHFSFALWFAISMALAQVSLSAAQTTPTYSGSETDESGSYSGPSSGGYTTEPSESQALTEYLKQRKLPLVGAQVLRGADGRRMVVLYGFVGSDFGKADATKKARRFLHDPNVTVANRINVRPELLASNRPSNAAPSNPDYAYPPAASSAPRSQGAPPADSSSSYPGPDSYLAQQANPYTQQLGSMMPLIALLGALGMSMVGGGSSFSFGTSPFRSPVPGNPYSSPFGSYGSPYGGSPFGASPYGVSPYGGSPFGNSPYGNAPYGSPPYPYP
jgi:hypothetical protein